MKFRLYGMFAILCVVSILACEKKTTPPMQSTNSCSNATLTCDINGMPFTATSFNNTLIQDPSGAQVGSRLDIRGTDSDGNQLILSVSDVFGTPDCLSVDEYSLDALNNTAGQGGARSAALGTFLYNGTNYTSGAPIGDPNAGAIELTSCNGTDHIVSGTFEFDLFVFGNSDTLSITNGEFTNACFTAL